jgi:hypothetical protein
MRALILIATLAASAHAAPRGTYIPVPEPPRFSDAPSSTLIYVKRCPSNGCSVKFGNVDDSRTQTSTLATGNVSIGGFSQGDQVWSDLVDCVKTTYSPFGVTVTDVDPGNVPHYENIVGGKPEDLNPAFAGMGIGGVAPVACGEIANGISYTFDVYGPDALSLCWTVSQETAHVFGLDHEYLPPDPMTYQEGDLPKRFQDTEGPCGEYMPRACRCVGSTQNSYRKILALFGPGAPITPDVAISAPIDGGTVQPGSPVYASATSIVRIDHVELYIDGALTAMSTTAPYVFHLDNVDPGDHAIEVRAIDVQGTMGSATATVTMGPPCTSGKICTGADVCVMGVCTLGPSASGGLGAECTDNAQCFDMLCVDGGDPSKHCVAACDPATKGACPGGFSCVPAGGSGVCYPNPDSGGCCEAGGSPRGAIALGALVWVAILRRRR